MDELGLFTAALGLSGPWRVACTEFDAQQTRLDLYLEFDRGARFPCPAGGCAHDACPVHDTAEKTWRHLDFFQHKALLHAGCRGCAAPSTGCGRWACPGRARARCSQCCSRRWC